MFLIYTSPRTQANDLCIPHITLFGWKTPVCILDLFFCFCFLLLFFRTSYMWLLHPSRQQELATASMHSSCTAANSTKKSLNLWVQSLVNPCCSIDVHYSHLFDLVTGDLLSRNLTLWNMGLFSLWNYFESIYYNLCIKPSLCVAVSGELHVSIHHWLQVRLSLFWFLCLCENISLVFSYHAHLSSPPFVLFLISLLLAWFLFTFPLTPITNSPLFLLSSVPLPPPLPLSFPSLFPRVVYQALSFLCVQLSVRGYSTPHALLERRPVNKADLNKHIDTHSFDVWYTIMSEHAVNFSQKTCFQLQQGWGLLKVFEPSRVNAKKLCETVWSRQRICDSLSHNISAVQLILSSFISLLLHSYLGSM